MQSLGETEILIETTIVGKVRVQNVSALDALAGDHAGALTECRKAIEALETLDSGKDLAAHLGRAHDSRRGKLYSGVSSRLKELASLAVHDYGRGASFSRTEIGFLIRTTASLAALVLESTPNAPED